MKYPIIIACSALLATAAVAGDKEGKEGSAGTFKTLDADGDGRISKTEATAKESIASNFDALDSDSDGFVSEREFKRNTMPRSKPSY